MAKTVGEFIFELAKKAGISESDEALVKFAQDKDLFTKPLSEEIEKGIDNQLISLKDAKNNHPEIKAFYQKQSLDGMDRVISGLLEDLDEETKATILSEGNTYKKVPIMVAKIKELTAQKAGAQNKGDKAQIQQQIDDLNKALAAEKENAANAKKQFDSELSKVKIDYKLNSLLAPYKTTLDELGEVKELTIKNLIQKELQDNKGLFAIDENGNLMLQKEGGVNYYGDDNKQVDPKNFIEKILSRNKLLKVNDQSSNGNGENQNGQQYQRQQPGGGNGATQKDHTLSGLAKQALQDIENSSKTSVMG